MTIQVIYKKPKQIMYGVENLSGGVLRHIMYLVSHVDPKEFQIHILTSSFYHCPKAVEQLKEKGVYVLHIPLSRKPNPLLFMKSVRLILNYVRKNDISLIHAHSSVAGAVFRIAALLCRVKIIYTPHCFYFHSCRGLKKVFYKMVESVLAYKTDAIIVSENETDAIFLRSDVHVINNAIDPNEYCLHDKQIVLQELNIPDSKIIIGGIGRLVPQKGWLSFLDLAQELYRRHPGKYYFLLAGEGPERNNIGREIHRRGLSDHVRLVGFVSDISKVYSCIDIFISTSAWDGLPYTYLEASHYDIPMFLHRTYKIEAVFELSSCIFFSLPKDMDKVAESILNQQYPLRAIIKIDVSLQQFIGKHVRLYRNLIC